MHPWVKLPDECSILRERERAKLALGAEVDARVSAPVPSNPHSKAANS
jgi:hypothetical protein